MAPTLYELTGSDMTVTVSSRGAELQSLRYRGSEYLWQGDPEFWPDRSPLLFPFVGRFTEGKYRYHGREYPMDIHGFARNSDFRVLSSWGGACAAGDDEKKSGIEKKSEHSAADGVGAPDTLDEAGAPDTTNNAGAPGSEDGLCSGITLLLEDSDQTRAIYPCSFALFVTYEIQGNRLTVSYRVENPSEEMIYFGIGGHPGFRLPLEEGLAFEDYSLTFSEAHTPMRVGHSPDLLLSGTDSPYPLEEDRRLPLRHDLFDQDAIVLRDAAHEVTLAAEGGSRSVTMSYPDLPYLGIWHAPRTRAPYVCIEPWTSLPSRQGIVEEFSAKSDLVRLPAGQTYRAGWQVSLT